MVTGGRGRGTQEPAYLQLSGVGKRYAGNPRPALAGVSLALERGAVLALLGESGSGKTTLLRLVAGFDQPGAGTIHLGGTLVAGGRVSVPPEDRAVGVVFQETALLPHLTILQNVSFGLRRLPEPRRRQRAEHTLGLMRITDLRDRYPHEVSGGQAQRAAIGRALAPQPALLLFDEPFNNLDPVLKGHLLHEVREVLRATRTTAVFVTHDRDEAFTVADRIALLHRGRIEQVGDAESLYSAPANAFVAEYLGAANLLAVRRVGAAWRCALGRLANAVPFRLNGGPAVSVRPAQLLVAAATDSGGDSANGHLPPGLRGVIQAQRFMGEFRELRVRVDDSAGAADDDLPAVRELTVHVPACRRFHTGQPVTVALTGAPVSRPAAPRPGPGS